MLDGVCTPTIPESWPMVAPRAASSQIAKAATEMTAGSSGAIENNV